MNKLWHVYICNRAGQLYTGITTDLEHRMRQHRARLLFSEPFENEYQTAKHEKEIKGWRREKKMQLIKSGR
jgi:predicted GIY-YIG superfamily endonuclease